VDGSVVFARWRQCALPSKIRFLRPTGVIPKTVYRSVQLFLHSSQQKVPILYNGPPLSPSKLPPSHMGIWTPSNTRFRGPTTVHNPNGISNGSPVLQGLRSWQTDSVCNNRPHVGSTVMHPNNDYYKFTAESNVNELRKRNSICQSYGQNIMAFLWLSGQWAGFFFCTTVYSLIYSSYKIHTTS